MVRVRVRVRVRVWAGQGQGQGSGSGSGEGGGNGSGNAAGTAAEAEVERNGSEARAPAAVPAPTRRRQQRPTRWQHARVNGPNGRSRAFVLSADPGAAPAHRTYGGVNPDGMPLAEGMPAGGATGAAVTGEAGAIERAPIPEDYQDQVRRFFGGP